MAHAARAHVTWLSVVIMVAVTSSCITWFIVSMVQECQRVTIVKSISGHDLDRIPASTAHCLFKVRSTTTKDKYLAWAEEEVCSNVSLDGDNTWITVEKRGVYLVYVQLTYSLKNTSENFSKMSTVDLMLNVEFWYPNKTEEFSGAFETRQLTEKETDAHLSAFILLKMDSKNRLSIQAHPKAMIKYNDIRPFSSYITIIRYADW